MASLLLQLALSQAPYLTIALVALVVAAIVIKGPARLLAVAGVAVGLLSSALWIVFIAVSGGRPVALGALSVVNLLLGLLETALLVSSVIVGYRWGQRRSGGADAPRSWNAVGPGSAGPYASTPYGAPAPGQHQGDAAVNPYGEQAQGQSRPGQLPPQV